MDRYEALRHAVKAHAGEVDKCGCPAILHPVAVAEALERGGSPYETDIVVALLHDVWEDTDYSAHNGYLTRAQQSALEAITRRDDETYFDYIRRCAPVPHAGAVKLADLWHNLSPERQGCLPEREARGLGKRYLKARRMVWDELGFEWWPDRV